MKNKIQEIRKYIDKEIMRSIKRDMMDCTEHQEVLDKIDEMLVAIINNPTPIEDLKLSVRQYNCLQHAGINTVEELSKHNTESLLKVRNLSKRDIYDLLEKGYITKEK